MTIEQSATNLTDELSGMAAIMPQWSPVLDEAITFIKHLTTLTKPLEDENKRLREAIEGMLENYIVLKGISLAMARSDAPNWVGARMTPEDDVHVIAARKALTKPT